MKLAIKLFIFVALSCVYGRKLKREPPIQIEEPSTKAKSSETMKEVKNTIYAILEDLKGSVNLLEYHKPRISVLDVQTLINSFYIHPTLSKMPEVEKSKETIIFILESLFLSKKLKDTLDKMESSANDDSQTTDDSIEEEKSVQNFGRYDIKDLTNRRINLPHYDSSEKKIHQYSVELGVISKIYQNMSEENKTYFDSHLENELTAVIKKVKEMNQGLSEYVAWYYTKDILPELLEIKKNPKIKTKCLASGKTNSKRDKFAIVMSIIKTLNGQTAYKDIGDKYQPDFEEMDPTVFIKCAYKYATHSKSLEVSDENKEAFRDFLKSFMQRKYNILEDDFKYIFSRLAKELGTKLLSPL